MLFPLLSVANNCPTTNDLWNFYNYASNKANYIIIILHTVFLTSKYLFCNADCRGAYAVIILAHHEALETESQPARASQGARL